MLLFNAPRKNSRASGFTLIETLTAIIVAGVLAAIAAPSLMGLLNQNRAKDSMRQIEGAIKLVQRQAIRRGKSCTLTINTSTKTMSATPSECLLDNRTVNDAVTIKADGNPVPTSIDLVFSHKGNRPSTAITGSDNAQQRTIAIYNSTTGTKYCVTVTTVLGAVKSGIYTGDVTGEILDDSCTINN